MTSEAPSAARWMGWLLAASQCLLAGWLAWQWLSVSTHRLYPDERRAPAGAAPARAQPSELTGCSNLEPPDT
jgi:hypothetical protein